ncbi:MULTISPECIES: hypothetical protein [unclassified Clostridium]|uniref:hypothetical protein n=1 Tax=unclassified Clostridium TaxID=2614128 RepID=UPI0014862DCC|nr:MULTISPECIES: hypothetical protein [unclassified Clostridium]
MAVFVYPPPPPAPPCNGFVDERFLDTSLPLPPPPTQNTSIVLNPSGIVYTCVPVIVIFCTPPVATVACLIVAGSYTGLHISPKLVVAYPKHVK